MPEPSVAILGGPHQGQVLRRHVLATRPRFLVASIMPVLVGTAWGAVAGGGLDTHLLVLALVAIVLVHGGINVLNDVYDDTCGTDRINTARIYPFTGGSRFIQNGVMTRADMRNLGIGLIVLAVVPGFLLFLERGLAVLALGAAGIALGILYSAPPVRLSDRGMGEIAVGLGLGILPVMGAAWLQSGLWDGMAAVLSLPIAIWVGLILLVNEVPDAAADGATAKRTLAVRLGPQGTARLYLGAQIAAVLIIALLIYSGTLSPFAVVVPALLLMAAGRAAKTIARHQGKARDYVSAIKITLLIHGAGSLWLAAWIGMNA